MVQHPTLVSEQAVDDLKVICQMLQPHVFKHAHAGNAIKLPRHLPVILQPDVHQVLQTRLFNPLGGQFKLRFR